MQINAYAAENQDQFFEKMAAQNGEINNLKSRFFVLNY
jgi:hypothetical protein